MLCGRYHIAHAHHERCIPVFKRSSYFARLTLTTIVATSELGPESKNAILVGSGIFAGTTLVRSRIFTDSVLFGSGVFTGTTL